MNKNNLSWVDNKVFNNPGAAQNTTLPMRPFMDTEPAQFQAAPAATAPAGVTPATYQDPAAMPPGSAGTSPEQFQLPPVFYPVQAGQLPAAGTATGMGMPGTLTRDVTYGPSPISVQGPPTAMDPGYIPAYLRSQIGKRVRAEFAIGANLYTDRTGILREVGFSYLVLEDLISRAMVMCDLYSLKFLTSL